MNTKIVIAVLLFLGGFLIAQNNFKSSKMKIGVLLTPSCRAADIIGFETSIRFSTTSEIYYISEKPKKGKNLKVGIFLPDVIGAIDVFSFIPGVAFYYLAKANSMTSSYGDNIALFPNTNLSEAPQLDVFVVGAAGSKYVCDKESTQFIRKQEPNLSAIISVC